MKDGKEIISIILPVYNRETTLGRAIESVLHQSISNWELILIDDGSSDRSGEICDEYMLRDNRIKVFHTEHVSDSHARNVGLANSMGEWIAFLDSDDDYLDDALFQMYSNISDDADLVIALGDINVCSFKPDKPTLVELKSKESTELLYSHLYNNVCSKLFRKSKIVKRFDETIVRPGDFPFTLNFIDHIDRLMFVPRVVSRYYEDLAIRITTCFHVTELNTRKNIYYKLVSLFPSDEEKIWIGDYFVYWSVMYFFCLIKNSHLNSQYLSFIIQNQLEDNILPLKDDLRTDSCSRLHKVLWKVLCSMDADTVIQCFSENYEAYVGTANSQG